MKIWPVNRMRLELQASTQPFIVAPSKQEAGISMLKSKEQLSGNIVWPASQGFGHLPGTQTDAAHKTGTYACSWMLSSFTGMVCSSCEEMRVKASLRL